LKNSVPIEEYVYLLQLVLVLGSLPQYQHMIASESDLSPAIR
jgi:hypothetical protein